MHAMDIHEAKTHFSKVIASAILGHETVIAKAGIPVAKVVPIQQKKPRRKFGVMIEKYEVLKDFPAKQFRRLTGVQRETFEKQVYSLNEFNAETGSRRDAEEIISH